MRTAPALRRRRLRAILLLGACTMWSSELTAQALDQVQETPAEMPGQTGATPSSPTSLRTAAPAGFQDLEGPVETFFDILYLNRRIGSFRATISGGLIRFADPTAVAAALGDQIDVPAVTGLLSQPLPLNQDRVCQPEAMDCGFLPVGTSGVIVDVENFSLNLFLDRKYLVSTGAANERLGPPMSGPSFVQNMLVSMSATTNGNNTLRYGGTFDSYASTGRTAAIAQHVLDDEQGLRLQSGYVQRIFSDRVAAAGLFTNFDSLLLDSYRLLGAQFRSLDRTRNVDSQMASPIEIVLPRSATVEIYRDGILLNSRRYAGGLQLLDTSTLPTGSYSLRIVARDGGATLLDETRTFVKVADLPAPGEIRFALRAGTRVDDSFSRTLNGAHQPYFPTVLGQPVAQAQAAMRLSAATAISASLLAIDERVFGESSFSAFVGRLRGTLAGAAGSDGSWGAFATGSWILPDISVNVTGRTVHAARTLSGLPSNDSRRFDYYPFIRSEDSVLTSVQFRLAGGSMSVSGSYTRSPFLDDRYAVTTRYSRPVRIARLGYGSVSAYGLVSNLEQRIGVSFTFQSRLDRRTTLSYGGGGEYVGKGGGTLRKGFSPILRAVATRRDRVGAVDLTSQAGVLTDASSDRIFADTAANSTYGSADIALQYERGRANESYGSFQFNGQSGFVIGGGAIKFGLRQPGEAFALVDIDAEQAKGAGNGGYRVLVDGQPYDYVPVGATAAVGLEALANYRIGLDPEDAPPFEIDLGERRVTLFPGNVVRLQWKAERSFSVFGQAVDLDGQPIAGARIRSGTDIIVADDHGYFTVTGTKTTLLEIRRADGTDCLSIPLGTLVARPSEAAIERLGPVRCTQMPANAAPRSQTNPAARGVDDASPAVGKSSRDSEPGPAVGRLTIKRLLGVARADLAALDMLLRTDA